MRVRAHLLDIVKISSVTALELGESLRIKVIVEEGDLAMSGDKDTAFSPPRHLGDEVRWAGELDVDIHSLFERPYPLEHTTRFWIEA